MIKDDAFGSFMQQPAVPQQHSESTGAGEKSIMDILEVVESDFASKLAKVAEESDAAADHEKVPQGNKATKATEEQDVTYTTQEFTSLDKTIDDISGDRQNANEDLASVMEYYGQAKDRCTAKQETDEDHQAVIKGVMDETSKTVDTDNNGNDCADAFIVFILFVLVFSTHPLKFWVFICGSCTNTF